MSYVIRRHNDINGFVFWIKLVTITLEKNDKGFVNVVRVDKEVDPDVTLKDFAQKVEGNAEERFNNVLTILNDVSIERKFLYGEDGATISELAIHLYEEYEEQLKWSAAAELMHSEKAGGLMEHTEAMVRSALKLCEVYSDLDKELLVTAAALHDIGKIEELYTNPLGRATYAPEGIGIGHLVIGYTYVDRFVQKNLGLYPSDRVFLLESMILSHHGEKEYGSPVEPIVKEAYMLHFIDNMDAKYHEMKNAVSTVNPGEISESRALGIGHRIYNPVA
jgi:3'-5' exoribonuclease